MEAIIGIIVALVLAVLTPQVQAYGAKHINKLRRARSYARITSRPGNEIGTCINFYCPDKGAGSARLGGQWEIADISRDGGVRLRSLENLGKWAYTEVRMDCTEFEAGQPVILGKLDSSKCD